jgi:hypothetical protein
MALRRGFARGSSARQRATGSTENARVMGMVKAGDATNDGPIKVKLFLLSRLNPSP